MGPSTPEQRVQPKRPGPWRPRLRTILLLVHLLILCLPLAGIFVLRLYDSALVRQTESELIVQGASIAAAHRAELRRVAAEQGVDLATWGAELAHVPHAHLPDDPDADPEEEQPKDFDPALPGLDLVRHQPLPPAPDGKVPERTADPLAAAAGERMVRQLAEIQRVTLAGLRILDPRGVVVASSGAETGLDLTNRPEVAAALAGWNASVLRRRVIDEPPPDLGGIQRGTPMRVVVGFPIVEDGRSWGAVLLARTPMSARQALWRERGHLMAGGMIILLVVALVTLLTAATVGRPIRALIAQTERVRRGERGAATPLEHPGTHEVARISQAVADMAAALEERADYIATFASNVSHEFKTPLTSIRGTVELLRDHLGTMSEDELDRFLSILDKDSSRLDRLVDRLLDLARADVVRPGAETCDAAEVVQEVVERFRRQDVRVEASLLRVDPEDGFLVAMAPETLDSVLSNLVDNARQHGSQGDDGPRIEITVDAPDREDMARIEVADDGPGISKANQARVFDRFFTTRREQGGSGLGLAIVRTLVRAHGGDVVLRSRPGRTVFEVRLPRGG